jgi:hypothetical protein
MPGERVSMRKIREVLRLRFAQGLSQRAIGISLGLSTGAVNSYLGRARMVGLGWPLADEFSDAELETLLYPAPPNVAAERRPVPNWSVVHRELRRPNMTLALLWEEYRGGIGGQDGFGYSCYVAAQLMLRTCAHNLVHRHADLCSIEVCHAPNQLPGPCYRSSA